MYLVRFVRSDFGRAFLLAEAGCRLAPIHDTYLSPQSERRDFRGFGVLHKDYDRKKEKNENQPLKFRRFPPLKKQESAFEDPSGVGLMSEVLPDAMYTQDTLVRVHKNDIPALHPASEFRPGYDLNERKYPALRKGVVSAISETKERYKKTWSIRVGTKLHLQQLLTEQQQALRHIDDAHALLEAEFAALVIHGEDYRTPTLKHVQTIYAELEDTVQDLESQLS
jgi:hypothetical protein